MISPSALRTAQLTWYGVLTPGILLSACWLATL